MPPRSDARRRWIPGAERSKPDAQPRPRNPLRDGNAVAAAGCQPRGDRLAAAAAGLCQGDRRADNPTLAGRLQTLEDIQRRKTDFEIEDFGYRYRGNTGNLVDAYTYYFGAYEKPQLFFMRDTLTATGPQAVTLDVGANLGLYTLPAARYSGQVHAFEPYPPVLARLRHNLESNQVPNVTVHPVGLGATEADLPFAPPPDDNLGLGSFEHVTGGAADQRLKVVAGDVYLREAGVTRVDFIKMDIEGFEKPALAGLRQTLQRDRPIVLLEGVDQPG